MKNIIAIVIFSFFSIIANGQYGVDNIFRKYKNDKGVVAWQFEGDINTMMNREDGEEIKSTIESVDFVLFSDGGDIKDKDKIKLKTKIADDKYEILIQARDKGQKLKIMGIEDGNSIKKVFAQMTMEKLNAYFFLTGEIYLEDLQKIDFKTLLDGMDF